MIKRAVFFLIVMLSCLSLQAQVSAIVGEWVTVDDKTGIEKSLVKIFKATDGLYYGKILRLYEEKYQGAVCIPCKGADKDKPVEGLIIIRAMKEENGQLSGGSVLDPESGNIYYGKIYFGDDGTLRLRGSVDKRGWFGRTQTWIRKK